MGVLMTSNPLSLDYYFLDGGQCVVGHPIHPFSSFASSRPFVTCRL